MVNDAMSKDSTLTAEDALEEVVANACEDMLRNDAVLRSLLESHKTLVEKTKPFVSKHRIFGIFYHGGGEPRSNLVKNHANFLQNLPKTALKVPNPTFRTLLIGRNYLKFRIK